MTSLRTFIALPASEEVRNSIAAVQSSLRSAGNGVRWETPDKFHMTLKFLGFTTPSPLEKVAAALDSIAQSCSPFTLVYSRTGAFPASGRPRVIWIGAEDIPPLKALQKAVEQACSHAGCAPEEHEFHPHITLGRVKEENPNGRLTEAIKTCTFEPIQFQCTEIVLMKSELQRSGSVYTKLKSFPFHS
jgi:2'-5' RNA ligase